MVLTFHLDTLSCGEESPCSNKNRFPIENHATVNLTNVQILITQSDKLATSGGVEITLLGLTFRNLGTQKAIEEFQGHS